MGIIVTRWIKAQHLEQLHLSTIPFFRERWPNFKGPFSNIRSIFRDLHNIFTSFERLLYIPNHFFHRMNY